MPWLLGCSQIEISPALVACAPLLPSFPGQAPSEAGLRISNHGTLPVELVCTELDNRYWEEEDLLRSYNRHVLHGRRSWRRRGAGKPGSDRVQGCGQWEVVGLLARSAACVGMLWCWLLCATCMPQRRHGSERS